VDGPLLILIHSGADLEHVKVEKEGTPRSRRRPEETDWCREDFTSPFPLAVLWSSGSFNRPAEY
jgi:hypothetical protein